MVDEDDFIDREALLKGGLAPGRQASALLFAIESRTAHLVSQSQYATALYLTNKLVEERELEFLEALSSGRQLPLQPKIQDLERYAPGWIDLAAGADYSLKAALAFSLAAKYTFNAGLIPNIRAALGLDWEAVKRAYQRQYNQPLSSIYKPVIPWKERLRWVISRSAGRLEALPPFWIAFALTIPLGSGLLALPIAVAGVGPVVGILLVIIFGLLSALTTVALAEAVSRSGVASLGLGYLGQLVSEYLGGAASVFLSVTLAIDSFLVLIIFFLGVADTLEGASRLPAGLWIALLFAVVLFFLSRKSLNSTVASTLMVSVISLTILFILPVFALPYLNPANFKIGQAMPVDGGAMNYASIRLIFGVMISNFSSHLLVGNYGRVILRRDPSARSWIWGCLSAIGIAILVSCLWVLAINGAVPAEALIQETGTALTALADLASPVINWMGLIFVVLSLGIGCIHISLSLFFLVDERLPAHSARIGSSRSRFLLCILPAMGAFLATEWLSITGEGSFAGLLGFVGVMTLPLLAGVFPVLLLASTRRKGDIVPGFMLKWLGNPIILAVIYLVFVASIFLHGLFVFQANLEQAIILLVGCLVLVMTVIMFRQRALARRAVVELRHDLNTKGPTILNLVANGEPAMSDIWLGYKSGETHLKGCRAKIDNLALLHGMRIYLPFTGAEELKVWLHQVTTNWTSEVLPAEGTIHFAGRLLPYQSTSSDGQAFYELENEPCKLDIQLKGRDE